MRKEPLLKLFLLAGVPKAEAERMADELMASPEETAACVREALKELEKQDRREHNGD
jgi:hypothetical protein